MAQINKVNVSNTTYDISQSPDATFTATSNDNASPTSWTDVAVLASGETNSSIFSKISSMFKNIRFLYSKLGTTDISGIGASVTAAISALNTNKASTATFTSAAAGLVPEAKSGTTNMATSGYVLTGAGWKAGTKYNTDNNTTYAAATTAASGLMPALDGSADKCLLGDGTWGTAGSTYANVSTTAPGLAPTLSGTATEYLNGSGTWTTPTDTTYANYSSAAAGLVPAPTATQATTGYVLTGAGWAAGTKYNTDTNTTYANFTSAAAGLVPAAKSGSTNIATTGYVLTGAGWAAGTKYNTDTNTTYNTNVGCYGTLSGTTLTLNTRNFRV